MAKILKDDKILTFFGNFSPSQFNSLGAHDCKYRESLASLKKKIENSDNLPGKPFKGDIFKKIISKFEKSNVSEEMGKTKIRVFT